MDLIVRNVRLAQRPGGVPVDIGVAGGKIVAIERGLAAEADIYDAGGRLGCAGLIETHIHLDKSRIIDRCPPEAGRDSDDLATGDTDIDGLRVWPSRQTDIANNQVHAICG